jgi:hypothetical protein
VEDFTMRYGGLWIGFTVVALIASSVACSFGRLQAVRGSGRSEEKTVQVKDFDGVVLTNQAHLTIAYGAEEVLVIEAEENLLPYLEVRVEDRVLHIGTRPNVWLRPTRPIRCRLTVTELSSIVLTGSGDAEGPVLKGQDVSIRITGSGDLTLDGIAAEDTAKIKLTGSGKARVIGDDADGASVRGDRVHATVTGSGNVDLGEMAAGQLEVRLTSSGDLTVEGGRVQSQTISTTGSGIYRALDLESATAAVRVTGSGHVTVRVADELEARLTGSGNVRYAGHPAVRADTSGSGDVVPVGERVGESAS